MELGPPLWRLAAVGLLAVLYACGAPTPSFEPEGIRLPTRDYREADAAADAAPSAPNENRPPPDAGPKEDVVTDPCAAKDLVSCFAFEDSVTDAKGKLVPSDVTGVAFAAGKTGKGARLGSGQGSRVSFTATDTIATAEATVETWLKLDPTFSQEATIFHVDQRYVMVVEADRTLLCASPGGAARGNLVTLDKWVHLACVFGGGSVNAYVDGAAGQRIGSFTNMPPTAPALVEIGSDPPDGTRPLMGTLDTLRVFSVARTPAEVAAAAKP